MTRVSEFHMLIITNIWSTTIDNEILFINHCRIYTSKSNNLISTLQNIHIYI